MNRSEFLALVGTVEQAKGMAVMQEQRALTIWEEIKPRAYKKGMVIPTEQMTPADAARFKEMEALRHSSHAWNNEAFRRGKVINDPVSHLSAHELRNVGLTHLADKLDALLSAYRAGIAAVVAEHEVPSQEQRQNAA